VSQRLAGVRQAEYCLAAKYPRYEPYGLMSTRTDPCEGCRATGIPTATGLMVKGFAQGTAHAHRSTWKIKELQRISFGRRIAYKPVVKVLERRQVVVIRGKNALLENQYCLCFCSHFCNPLWRERSLKIPRMPPRGGARTLRNRQEIG
jgi:hypothetical protein